MIQATSGRARIFGVVVGPAALGLLIGRLCGRWPSRPLGVAGHDVASRSSKSSFLCLTERRFVGPLERSDDAPALGLPNLLERTRRGVHE